MLAIGHLFYYQDQNALSNAFLFKFVNPLGSKELTSLTMEAINSTANAITVYSALRVIFLGGGDGREGWAISSKLLLFQQ